MRKKYDKDGKLLNDSFKDMYDSLTNPDRIEENKHKHNVKQKELFNNSDKQIKIEKHKIKNTKYMKKIFNKFKHFLSKINWFKTILLLGIIILGILWLLSQRYYFMSSKSGRYTKRCNRITGHCEIIKNKLSY